MNIGFIGTGLITEAVVTGLCSAAEQQLDTICLSPRNTQRSKALAERFKQVTVAKDNQAVVDNSEIVCLAIRPQIAKEIVEPLDFRPEQIVVSFIAAISSKDIAHMVRTPATICRLIPLPVIAKHEGPVVLSPPVPEVANLFQHLGTLVQVNGDEQLNALLSVTALMAPFFQVLDQTSEWLGKNGIEKQSACRYVGSMIQALSVTAKEEGENGYAVLTAGHATPEGLNEQALRELQKQGCYKEFLKVLDLIHARTIGKAGFDDTVK